MSSPVPRLSVIVRSYNRLGALCELLDRLLRQTHDSFEIVVVEQSTERPPDAVAELARRAADPRVRIHRFPPLGGPRARNAGVRLAKGNLLVFIDDDDLPLADNWLELHENNAADPKCLGVTGQFVGEDGDEQPYGNQARALRRVLSFNWLRWQYVYARTNQRKLVQSLMGGNAAIPRTTLARFGLWDECTPIEDEPSLAFRIARGKQADEYLLFDPAPKMIRRLEVPGGMAKRGLSGFAYGHRVFLYLHNVLRHYHPWRFALLYPAYIMFLAVHVIEWIVSDSKRHQTAPQRLRGALAVTLGVVPWWFMWTGQWLWARAKSPALVHGPRLEDANPSELPP